MREFAWVYVLNVDMEAVGADRSGCVGSMDMRVPGCTYHMQGDP